MNLEALYGDGTSSYVVPAEPLENETVTLRFRTARDDADEVFVIIWPEAMLEAGGPGHGGEEIIQKAGRPVYDGEDGGGWPADGERGRGGSPGRHEMKKVGSRGAFDYYEYAYDLGTSPISYQFEIHGGGGKCYYNSCGMAEQVEESYFFRIVPGFSTPAWAKGAVMYQVFVDRFYNGDSENDVVDGEYVYIGNPSRKVEDWGAPVESMDVHRFYGGDLRGVMRKLDYLQGLGVQVVYFNPLFVSPSNHKYDIQDYDYIDPHYGKIVADGGERLPDGATDNVEATKYQKRTGDKANLEASNALFAKLVDEMHRRGMRVILDGVFNHCGSFNKWMDRERIYERQSGYAKGAYVSGDSPYRSFFRFRGEEPDKWPYNGNYDGWWGHDTLPKLNYEDSPKLEQYIIDIGKKWVSPPYNVDGWRLDVAADLGRTQEYNHKFWKRFRREVKSVRPDALILAEHYGDPEEWLKGDEWDGVMNYDAFMEPLTWFLTGMEKHGDERRKDLWGNAGYFINMMKYSMARMLTPSLQVAMNQLSNHDHSRFLTRTNHLVGRLEDLGSGAAGENVNVAVLCEAVAVQMTWPGAPCVYYGDEAGQVGFTDPDNRRTYPWGRENRRVLDFHREMIRIHREQRALCEGSLKILLGDKHILAYGRFQGDDQIVVILNNNNWQREVTVPVWPAEVPMEGAMCRLMYSYEDGFLANYDEYLVKNGEVVANMGAHSVLILKTMKHCERKGE